MLHIVSGLAPSESQTIGKVTVSKVMSIGRDDNDPVAIHGIGLIAMTDGPMKGLPAIIPCFRMILSILPKLRVVRIPLPEPVVDPPSRTPTKGLY